MTTSETSPEWVLPGAVAYDVNGEPVMVAGSCTACGETVFPKPKVCPKCWSEAISGKPLARTGTLYSYTVVHVARKGWKTPYVVSYVDLDDGIRVSAPLDCEPSSPPPLDSRVSLRIREISRREDGTPVLSHFFGQEA